MGKTDNSRAKKIVVGLAVAFVLVVCSCMGITLALDNAAAPQPTSRIDAPVLAPTNTASPTIEPVATETQIPSPTQTTAPTQTAEPTKDSSVADYATEMLVPMGYIMDGLDYQNELFGLASEAPTLMYNQTWQEEVAKALATQKKGSDIIYGIKPPESMENTHSLLLLALGERSLMEANILKFLETMDIDYITAATDNMLRFTDYLEKSRLTMP